MALTGSVQQTHFHAIQIWPNGPFKLILCFVWFSYVNNDEKYYTFSGFAIDNCAAANLDYFLIF